MISSGRWRYDTNLHLQLHAPSLDPSPGATIALDVSEIEDAGIREVLQTPGAA